MVNLRAVWPLLIAIVLFVLILVIYAVCLLKCDPISTGDLANFGSFVGGLLNPAFGLLTILLVCLTLAETRRQGAHTERVADFEICATLVAHLKREADGAQKAASHDSSLFQAEASDKYVRANKLSELMKAEEARLLEKYKLTFK